MLEHAEKSEGEKECDGEGDSFGSGVLWNGGMIQFIYRHIASAVSGAEVHEPPLRKRGPAGRWMNATVISCFLLFCIPSIASAKLLINEIMWMGSDLSTSDEWVELTRDPRYADCASSMSLSGATLTVLNSSSVEVPIIRFAQGTSLLCGQYLLISHFAEPASRLSVNPDYVETGFSLLNTKLLLRLRDAEGTVVDLADDGIGEPMAGLNNTSGGIRASMERVDFSFDGGLKTNWRTADTVVGFDAGFSNFGTPGFANGGASSSAESSVASGSLPQASSSASSASSSDQSSQQSSDAIFSSESSSQQDSSLSSSLVPSVPLIIISEVLPNPVGLDTDEWIEIAHTGSGAVDIAGWTLSVSGSTVSYRFPAPFVLSSGVFQALRRTVTGIALDNKGKTIVLRQGSTVIDALPYFEVPEGVSIGRSPADRAIHAYCVPTESAPNERRPANADIVVQSGTTSGEEQVTVNLTSRIDQSIQSSAECAWDFGDGFRTTSCNPPSHTFEDPGQYTVRLEVRDYCINTVERSITISVYEKRSSSSSSRQSSSASSWSSVPSQNPATQQQYPATQQQPSPAAGGGASKDFSAILMTGALPNPKGLDAHQEWVEIENTSAVKVTLTGWNLVEATQNKSCPLDQITIEPYGKRKVQIDVCKWALINTKGALRLKDPSGELRSLIQWEKAVEGKVYLPQQASTLSGTGFTVVRVIDGDTIVVQSLVSARDDNAGRIITIRLLGIDAPEITHDSHGEELYSFEAKKFLEALTGNKKIELQFNSNKTDVYGRILAFLFVEGKDVQQELLRAGLARVYLRFPSSRETEYLAYEMEARREGRGIWTIDNASIPHPGTGAAENSITQQQPSAAAGKVVVSPIYLSEIYPAPKLGEDEWIEIYNPNSVSVPLGNWILDDVKNGGSKPYTFPEGSWMNAGEYLSVYAQQSGLKLNDSGDEVRLTSPDGSFGDQMNYEKARKGQSIARSNTNFDQNSASSADSWCMASGPTPGAKNICIDQRLYSKESPASASIALNSGPRSVGLTLRYQTDLQEGENGSGTAQEEMSGALDLLKGQLIETNLQSRTVSAHQSNAPLAVLLIVSSVVGMGFIAFRVGFF